MLKKELEVGKTYIDGMGETVTIISRTICLYPYISENGDSYTSLGQYHITSENKSCDLVREATICNPNQPREEVMIQLSIGNYDRLMHDFLDTEDNYNKDEYYDTARGLSEQALDKFRGFIFSKYLEKEERRKQYEELKKEFEAQ